MPTSPNSFMITATRRPCSAVRMRLSSVVLPEPRNPVRMMTEAFLVGFTAAVMTSRCAPRRPCARSIDDRQLHLADHAADRLAVLHLHVAAHDGVDRHALDLPAAPRRRMVLGVQLVRVDRRLLVHV